MFFNVNIREVINAAETKPYGFTRFDPGPELEDIVFQLILFTLTWKAKEFQVYIPDLLN